VIYAVVSRDFLCVGFGFGDEAYLVARFLEPVDPHAWSAALTEGFADPADGAVIRAVRRLAEAHPLEGFFEFPLPARPREVLGAAIEE
jgi:hypothetical protein